MRAAGDVLVIIEGLTMYLTQDEVAALMDLIATRLPGATVLIEVMPHFFQKYGRERSVVATGARFTYGCSGAEEFCSTVARTGGLSTTSPSVRPLRACGPGWRR